MQRCAVLRIEQQSQLHRTLSQDERLQSRIFWVDKKKSVSRDMGIAVHD